MKAVSRLIVVSLWVGVFSFLSKAQHGVGNQWSPEIELPMPPGSNSVRGSLYSNMGILSNGKRIVFLDRQDGQRGFYYTYSYDGINWSTPQRFAPDTTVIGLHGLKIIAGPNDTIHVIWASHLPKALYYTQMDSSLNIIIDSIRIADHPDFNSFNDMYITTDLQGRIHVMWNEGKPGSDIPEVYYTRSTDGGNTWSAKVRISAHDGKSSLFPRAQYNAYGGDTLAIAWRDSVMANNWNIHMVVSTNGGITWSAPFVINPNPNMQGDPDLVIDPWGRFHLFYHEAPQGNAYWGIRLMYGYSDDQGQTWHSPGPYDFDTISKHQRSYLAEGSRYDRQRQVLWTFWKEEDLMGRKGGDMLATYSLNRGISWSTPEYITDRHDSSIGYKAVAMLPNGGIGVNYELPNYPHAGQFHVYYKERTPPTLATYTPVTNNTISIWNHPGSPILNIQSPHPIQQITITNINGQIIRSFHPSHNLRSYAINMQNAVRGIYLLTITTQRLSTTRKITIDNIP